ncbi:hypothetical protein IW261DRAFT_1571498 [Armillaria novae-zelandiae]|uniref:Uncharacterized protein n=1 Tax=Armillaria novae-zelandiae TaxID=153914 RepID=A0AA39T8L3_9AGAR|nr:hypothetical protein IW261DRAFT_1571498 [Armillaria novae-zelandiae]
MPKAKESEHKVCPHCQGIFRARGFIPHKRACSRKVLEHQRNAQCRTQYREQFRSLPPRLNLSLATPSPSGATTSQECWEQAQPQPNEDFDSMEDVQPSLPEIASSSGSEPRVEYIRTEYHPHSNRPPRLDKVEEFQAQTKSSATLSLDDKPWSPFSSRDDFELAEWILESGINQGDIDALLTMMTKRGGQKAMHLHTTFESTTFTVPLKGEDYKFTVYHRDLWASTLDILQDPLLAPYLNWDAQQLFKVDGNTSQRFYMEPHTGNIFWEIQTALPTGGKPICYIIYADKTQLSSFGTVQGYPVIVRLGNLPSHIRNGQGVGGGCVIGWLPIIKEEAKHKDKSYYADFKRAVWHKAFESILLPIKGKSKFGAWVQVAGGTETTPCHLYLFPTIMILSADYEEQCMMALTRGSKAKFPCNVCLVPLEELYHANETYPLQSSAEAQRIYEEAAKIRGATKRNAYLKTFGLRFIKNTFWEIAHCDVHCALSFDRLHAFNNGLFADHLLEEIKGRILKLGPSFGQEADELLEAFPSWKDLYHFKQGFMNVSFTDGQKYEALTKQLIFIVHAIFTAAKDHVGSILLRALRIYMELDVYASLTLHTSDSLRDGWARIPILASLIEEYETPKETKTKNWNFPKAHSHQHLFDDIEAKGVTLNYNMKPNKSMHGSFKELYQRRTNFKNIDEQILRVDDWYNAMAYLRHQINHHDKIKKEFGDDQVAKGETRAEDKDKDEQVLVSGSANSDEDYTAAASLHGRHGKGGGKLTMAEVKAQAVDNSDFHEFRTHLSTHMKKHFESHPEELPSDNGIPAEFAGFECQDQISSYGMLKVNYSSVIDWCFTTDILQCSPNFHSCPRYDFVLLKTDQGPMFAQLVLVFECVVHGMTYPLMLVRPFGEAVGPMSQKDHDLGFYRVRTKIESNPFIISIYSVIQGALLIEDVTNQGGQPVKDYFVVDTIDADMFLRMQKLSYVGKATDAHRR